MIENLKGIYETVNYKQNTGLRLYVNDEFADYPSHWHSPVEVICPLEGGYRVFCNNTHTFSLREGDILIICPGTIHSLSPPGEGVRIIFQADCSTLYSIKQLETIFSLMAPALAITPEKLPRVYERIHALILEIRDEYLGTSSLSEASIYAKIIELIVLVGRNYTGEESRFDTTTRKQQEYNEKLLSICNYISEHCTENLSLDEVAAQAGFSKYYFERLFKQFTGVPFYRYLNHKRIALAEELLVDPDIAVTETAYRCGFSSASSFIRMFKIIKQCTPSEFRRMYRR